MHEGSKIYAWTIVSEYCIQFQQQETAQDSRSVKPMMMMFFVFQPSSSLYYLIEGVIDLQHCKTKKHVKTLR